MNLRIRFRPIDKWPRERNKKPQNSRFRTSYRQTLELLERELRCIDAKNVVIQVDLPESQIQSDENNLLLNFDSLDNCTFKLGDIEIHEPPICFTGSRFDIEVSRKGYIKSGCIEKPVDWWLENIERCAEENHYTPEQVAEYKMYVKMIVEWMERLNLNQVKET